MFRWVLSPFEGKHIIRVTLWGQKALWPHRRRHHMRDDPDE